MDHRSALILAASLLCGSVHAGYAQLAAPEGWSGGGSASATYRYPSAANAAAFSNATVLSNASLSVGGRVVQVPASMRLAANAPRIAAAAIFLHPGLRTVAAVAGWLGVAGLVYDAVDGLWKRVDPDVQKSDGKEYRSFFPGDVWRSSPESACKDLAVGYSSTYGYTVSFVQYVSGGAVCRLRLPSGQTSDYGPLEIRTGACPSGWFSTPAGCVQTAPLRTVTQPEFEQMVPDARPMPADLPGVVWPASWPVELPEIQPMFIPTGNPVKNPAHDPSKPLSPDNQPWLQPGVKLSPAPTPSSPWQVDLQPVNRPAASPTPNPNPVVDPLPNPDGSGSQDKPRDPEKDERDLCEKNPEILACQKLTPPEDSEKLPVKEVDFNFTPESGFSGNAVCPPDTVVTVVGHTISVPWHKFCDSLEMIRPMMLAMAWLMAAFILIGRR